MAGIRFALEMLKARLDPARRRCPYCQSRHHVHLQTKKIFIQARMCVYCGLIFRYPTDDPEKARGYYERRYQERRESDLPPKAELDRLLGDKFKGSEYDKSARVALLRTLVPVGRVLDYGCSWGYGARQLRDAGYDTVGFEISRNHAEYGRRHLELEILSSDDDLDREQHGFDVLYCEHVFEHALAPQAILDRFSKLLRPEGTLVLLTPNGAGLEARRKGVHWGPFIGEPHTLAITAEWLLRHLPRFGFDPRCYSAGADGRFSGDSLDGEELLCVAKKTGEKTRTDLY